MRFLFKNPVLRAASRERLVVDPLRSAAGRIVTRARIERDDDRANLYSAVGGQYNFCLSNSGIKPFQVEAKSTDLFLYRVHQRSPDSYVCRKPMIYGRFRTR